MTPLLIHASIVAALCLAAAPPVARAQTVSPPTEAVEMRQVSTHLGEMTMHPETGVRGVEDALRFEPFQQFDEMFGRDDVVFVMRHGPTDWSKLDEKGVAPDDCANQRVMVEEGMERMRDLGALLAGGDIVPSQILVSQWCRNQQTVDALLEGMARIDPGIAEEMPVETDPGLNLLLSLQGSRDVTGLKARVTSWDGHPSRPGPLLIVTHYTNIEEMTQFRVFEGEALVLDPMRDNLVLGYLRLRSAAPDVGHFADALASPLLDASTALTMVERYYDALGANDRTGVSAILADVWLGHGYRTQGGPVDADGLMTEAARWTRGLSGGRFEIDDVHIADDVITVIGTVRGRHTGPLFGFAPTGRDVAFDGIAVHRVREGRIVESWETGDRLGLLEQLEAAAE